MGSINWIHHTSRKELSWKTCQTLYRDRAWKRLVDRVDGEDPRLPRRVIAPYTDLFFDSEKNCFIVCVRFWSGSARFRKVLEVYEHDTWRLFGELGHAYDVDNVAERPPGLDWYRAKYVEDDIGFTNFARHRINQMLPIWLYFKRRAGTSGWFINNNRNPARNGMLINYHTNINHPKWWNTIASPFSHSEFRHFGANQHQDEKRALEDCKTVVSEYVNKFITSDKLKLKCEWLWELDPYYKEEDLTTRHNQVLIMWRCFHKDAPESKLYKMLRKNKKFPLALVRRALESFVIDKKFINTFMSKYENSASVRTTNIPFVKTILTKYLNSFNYRFAFVRSNRIHQELLGEESQNNNQRWGPGLHLMNTW